MYATKRFISIILCWIILIVIYANVSKSMLHKSFTRRHLKDYPEIYCLMMTGKDNDRNKLAKISIENFNLQTYPNKRMIIINESDTSCIKNAQSNILEMFVRKQTLGHMRNIALDLVPPSAIWTTWDDDDWRCNEYLDVLYKKLSENPKKKYLMYCNRLDHNLNTNFTWRVKIPSGTYIFFNYKTPRMKYENKNTKEDAVIKRYLYEHFKSTVLFTDNRYDMYIRFIHNNNTSIYVDNKKNAISKNNDSNNHVKEFHASEKEIKYINHIKKMYYT